MSGDPETPPQNLDLSQTRGAFKSAGQNLEFHEESFKSAVQACTDLIGVLENVQYQINSLQTVHGMEAFRSSQALAKGLGDRANMDTGHFGQAVDEHLKTARELRKSIEAAGKKYLDQDKQAAASLHNPSPDGQMAPLQDSSKSTPLKDPNAPLPKPENEETTAQSGGGTENQSSNQGTLQSDHYGQ